MEKILVAVSKIDFVISLFNQGSLLVASCHLICKLKNRLVGILRTIKLIATAKIVLSLLYIFVIILFVETRGYRLCDSG